MATHDYIISNASGAAVRSDLNNALAAIVSNNSSATEPATTYAYMWWADTTSGQLKLRNAANDDWVVLLELDGTMLMEDGTVAAPGLAFASDLDTGFYRPADNELGIATGGTNAVYIDDAQQVGIGSASPAERLTIEDGTNVVGGFGALAYTSYSNEGLGFTFGASNDGSRIMAIGVVDTNKLAITGREGIVFTGGGAGTYAGTSEIARFDDAGRLLVGTSSGGGVARLQVQGSTLFNDAFLDLAYNGAASSGIASGQNLGVLRFTDQASTANIFAQISCAADAAASSGDYPGRLVFSTTVDGASSPTEACRITNQRHLNFSDAASDPAGGSNIWQKSGFGLALMGGQMAFYAGTTERMRITSVGGLKCSNTGSYPLAATAVAHEISQSTANLAALHVQHTASTGNIYGVYCRFTQQNPNNATSYVFSGVDISFSNIYTIYSNGTVAARSDAKYKKNIETARHGYLEDLNQLRVVKYNWHNHDDDAPKELGFIAQEVEQVFPGLVSTQPDKDDQGNETGEVSKSIKTSVFTPMLVKALQEALERIETLEAKVAALEAA